jgi:prepilin-type N-terminal cleavage/methylation domain-containing protein
MKKNLRRTGFTLIELLISIILMLILLSAITLIFMRTTETVAIAQARMSVYTNARYALDIMENDLLGCLSFNSGVQRFCMENGKANGAGNMPLYGVTGNHIGNAADRLIFRSTTTIGNTVQTGEITYELIPASMSIGAGGVVTGGDGTRQQTMKNAPYRPLYTLIRRARVANPTNPTVYDQMPVAADPITGAPVPVNDMELCYFVTSFNLEYYANNMNFSQLEPSYFTQASGSGAYDPLGNGQGANDGAGGAQPYRVPFVRVTLTIVDDIGERQERTISKTMWIPMG